MWKVDYTYIEPWLDKQDLATVAHVFAAFEVMEAEDLFAKHQERLRGKK